jgi:hypothetical protein
MADEDVNMGKLSSDGIQGDGMGKGDCGTIRWDQDSDSEASSLRREAFF